MIAPIFRDAGVVSDDDNDDDDDDDGNESGDIGREQCDFGPARLHLT